jgi:hypothetical protein
MAHIEPLPAESTPELAETFRHFEEILGFVPNSLLTMQRRPAIVKAFGELTAAVMDPQGSVDPAFKRLLAHFASRAAGCQYCEAHSLVAAGISGLPAEKLDALWEYQTSEHYSEAERAALDFALGRRQRAQWRRRRIDGAPQGRTGATNRSSSYSPPSASTAFSTVGMIRWPPTWRTVRGNWAKNCSSVVDGMGVNTYLIRYVPQPS